MPTKNTIKVVLDPLPLPPDFNQRLAKIYALALQRYREHQEELERSQPAPADTMPRKRCIRGDACVHPEGPELPATSEYFSKRSDRQRNYCKACANARMRHYRSSNPDKIREDRAANRDKARESARRWHAANPDKRREKAQRRRARQRAAASTFTTQDWIFALEYWNGACAYCKHSSSLFDVNYVLHQEHYVPLSSDGAYTPDNILPACQNCNFSKGSKDPDVWLKERFGAKKAKRIKQEIADYFASVRKS